MEGLTDLIFLDRLARYVGREYRAGSVALIEAGGKGGISRIVRFLKAMNRLVKVVVDSDIVDQEGVLRQIAECMGDLKSEIAAAASILMGPAAEGVPAVVVRGLDLPRREGSAQELRRPRERDLFR